MKFAYPGLGLLVLILAALLLIICEACGHTCKNIHGLSKHQQTCKAVQALTEVSASAPSTSEHGELGKKRKKKREKQKKHDCQVSLVFISVYLYTFHDILPKIVQTDGDDEWMDIDISEPDVRRGESVPMPNGPPEIPSPPIFVPPPTRSGRARKFPKKFVDFLPNSTTQLPHLPALPPCPIPQQQTRSLPPTIPDPIRPTPPTPIVIQTPPNAFGLYCKYSTYPTAERDDQEDLKILCNAPGLGTGSSLLPKLWWKAIGLPDPTHKGGLFAPFLNATIFYLMNWLYSGSNTKSIGELDRLVKEVILADDFSKDHLKNFSAAHEPNRPDSEDPNKSPFSGENGWKTSTVKLSLPAEGVMHDSEASAPTLDVPNVYHRSLVSTIISVLQDESAKLFHYVPFWLFWKPTPTTIPEHVITELYNSDVFIEEHKKISRIPSPPGSGPTIENAIAAMMIWSNSMHLTNFGDVLLWPIYLLLGNQSKYTQGKPNLFVAHHVAYIPEVFFFFFKCLFHC